VRDTDQLAADNRKARHDFHILETFEAGVALLGTEVKAIREGRANLRDSYCKLNGGEAFLLNVHSTATADRRRTIRCGRGSCSCAGRSSTSCSGRRRRRA
jgi:tmRNA-binding protein